MKHLIFFSLFAFIFYACERQTDWELHNAAKDFIAVDATLTNEIKSHTVKLTLPFDMINDTPPPAAGASVIISNQDSVWGLTESPANSGIYKTAPYFKAVFGKQYALNINYNNRVYSAYARMAPGSDFQALRYVLNAPASKKNGRVMYNISWVAAAYNPNKYALWEILLDWSGVPGYTSLPSDSCKARLLYYTLPTLDVSQVLMPQIEKITFPQGTVITERRYSLTKEHAEFLRALLSETNWNGGLFDSQHANLPSNISNSAVGYFAVCAVNSVVLTVN